MLALVAFELGNDVAAPLRADAQRLALLVDGIAGERLFRALRGVVVMALIKSDLGTERERGGRAGVFLQQRRRDFFSFGNAPGVEMILGLLDARVGLGAPARRPRNRQGEKKSAGGEAKYWDRAAKNVEPR